MTQAIIRAGEKEKGRKAGVKVFTNSLFFGAAISLLAYEVGLLLRKKFKKAIFNPLLIGILCVIGVLSIFHIEYDSYNVGGQYISYLLTPATVCLAVPLYEQLSLLKEESCGRGSRHCLRCVGKYGQRAAFVQNFSSFPTKSM